MKNLKTLKILFLFLTSLMIFSIIFGVITENSLEVQASDRILAGVFGSIFVLVLNYIIYKLLAKIWK